MSDVLAHDAASVPAGAAAASTAGAMLRDAREAAGLHVAALAVALKVPVAKLEALEQDRYDLLPDAVFARALASSVCRTLKIDPGPVLERLPQTSAPRLIQDTDGINAPFRSPRDQVAATWRDHLTRPVSLVVGALLLGALVVMVWPHGPVGDIAAAARTEPPAASAAAPKAAAPAVTGGSESAPPSDSAVQTPVAEQPSASPLMPASITESAPSAVNRAAETAAPASAAVAAVPAAANPVAPSTAASAAEAADSVVFRASAPSWIEVRDAKGGVPIRKVLGAGESANVAGAMPLQVTVGNVNGTELDVRGKRFDLKAMARDNVARFQIK